jgi:hypothetical protein
VFWPGDDLLQVRQEVCVCVRLHRLRPQVGQLEPD